MAEGRGVPLTNRQIQRLAASISRHDMESIAMGYLNISHEKIKSCRGEETEAFNRRDDRSVGEQECKRSSNGK